MNKIIEILKRKISVTTITKKQEQLYFIDIYSNQITEEEYNLIREFIIQEEEEGHE